MDTKDIICDLIDDYLWGDDGHSNPLTGDEGEKLSIEICEKLGICEKCGSKLKGEDDE